MGGGDVAIGTCWSELGSRATQRAQKACPNGIQMPFRAGLSKNGVQTQVDHHGTGLGCRNLHEVGNLGHKFIAFRRGGRSGGDTRGLYGSGGILGPQSFA